jgi:hypothetical protein
VYSLFFSLFDLWMPCRFAFIFWFVFILLLSYCITFLFWGDRQKIGSNSQKKKLNYVRNIFLDLTRSKRHRNINTRTQKMAIPCK